MVYLNPGGFDFGSENLDGYGISNIVFGVVYSLFFYAAVIFVWLYRHHPILRMRNVPLMLLSLLTLHVFTFMVFVVYTLNGSFPCQVEFWCMSIYLPIGIGLFQAQNQQLLIVSQQQTEMLSKEESYRPILPKGGKGVGGPRYWLFRLRFWWRGVSTQGKYQGFVAIGIFVQFVVSFVIYNISRKFNHYGIVSKHVSPGMCRRGWEWAPSVIWQFLWNYLFGPYLIWKVRTIHDIYHWRLQTILAVVCGLPGTPIWLAAVYTDSFGPVNKYWIPAMWFIPGLMMMEVVTLGFPIVQIYRHKRAALETHRALEEFDQKHLYGNLSDGSTIMGSMTTRSTNSKRGKMFSMESLDDSLAHNYDGLQVYASCMELNGENIIFLTKVLAFRRRCAEGFQSSCKSTSDFRVARTAMFRVALSIYVTLVHSRTASYPINIESNIYARLEAIFGPATALVASETKSRSPSITTEISNVTPWDAPPDSDDTDTHSGDDYGSSYPMQSMSRSKGGIINTLSRESSGNDSTEHIVSLGAGQIKMVSMEPGTADPLEGVKVPSDFDERVFEDAYKSIRYMVWSETWQRYRLWKKKSGSEDGLEAL